MAGNAIETPRLLLNSHSSAFPDGLGNSSGQVGRNYTRIAESFVYGEFDRPVHMYRGVQGPGVLLDESHHDPARGFAGGVVMMPIGTGLFGYAATLDPGGWSRTCARAIEGYQNAVGISINGADMPMEGNGVRLDDRERDHHGLPIPVLHIDDHPNDVAIMNHGLKCATALLRAAGARRTYEAPPPPRLAEPGQLPHERQAR